MSLQALVVIGLMAVASALNAIAGQELVAAVLLAAAVISYFLAGIEKAIKP